MNDDRFIIVIDIIQLFLKKKTNYYIFFAKNKNLFYYDILIFKQKFNYIVLNIFITKQCYIITKGHKMSTNATTVKFYLGEESRLVIENFSIKDESIFKDSYNTALSILNSLSFDNTSVIRTIK